MQQTNVVNSGISYVRTVKGLVKYVLSEELNVLPENVAGTRQHCPSKGDVRLRKKSVKGDYTVYVQYFQM